MKLDCDFLGGLIFKRELEFIESFGVFLEEWAEINKSSESPSSSSWINSWKYLVFLLFSWLSNKDL